MNTENAAISIYFDELNHKYTDSFSNRYTSVTTSIGELEEKKDFKKIARACEKIGRNPRHPKYKKYKGRNAKEILKDWKDITDNSLVIGNENHDFLEQCIKTSNGYKRYGDEQFINDKIYTIPDILENHGYGRVNLDHFVKTGIKERYPLIYVLIEHYVQLGYRLYSEICTFSSYHLISGLIDLLLVKDDKFIIIDWKTNKADIMYDSGYFEKDAQGELTDNFIYTREYFLPPIHHLQVSTGNKYTLQLSMYDYLTERFGLTCEYNILCHIRRIKQYTQEDAVKHPDLDILGKDVVDFLPIAYLKDDVKAILDNHYNLRVNKQLKLKVR